MKDLKISKKLISEVLKIPLDVINEVYFDKTNLLVRKLNNRIEEHNIYEFAFKCKEWAENKDYIIFSKNKECLIYSIDEVYDVIECLNQYEDYFEADTECEAILKACEWILDNEKNPK